MCIRDSSKTLRYWITCPESGLHDVIGKHLSLIHIQMCIRDRDGALPLPVVPRRVRAWEGGVEMKDGYESFLAGKARRAVPCGFEPRGLNPALFGFQRDVVRWACRKGKAAVFADCGLGKTLVQLELSLIHI